ncbi:MAG TPA: hypothetical protein V6D22_01120 [Candidatus Obscuribacterales bacterium]
MAATHGGATEGYAVQQIEKQQPQAQTDTTAEVVGRDNGKTSIGTSARDAGKAITTGEAAKTMSQLGLDKIMIGDDPKSIEKIFNQMQQPTDQERKDAQSQLDGQMSKLLPPEDQKTLGAMQKAVLDGDTKGFGQAIAKFKDNPEKLKAYLDEMNKNLKQSGSDTRADVDSKGNVILHNGGDTGVVFGADGKAAVHEIKHRPDGSVVVGGEVVGGEGADAVMKRIGDSAVTDITRGGNSNKEPIWPENPPNKPFPWPRPEPGPDWPQHNRPFVHQHPPIWLYKINRGNTDVQELIQKPTDTDKHR